ncbi:Mannose-6-phosphate isomerase, cupin superfamily [Austwickia chelonae]|uniref:Cupin 2 conserved barrel domain-containing protein n=1 Tax=Austwickia chelonae NBRC 105200 TaxID=1184607 RepID=K6W4Q2_9MICO|nr:hypothetical protein [Austwickia chelonae]GAB76792.1 hypothetical protein AUCHE_03_00090 [Austwickia chelonae NBRC 105200]SEW30784.1 Mannose-6-phosphate isomerase, cupin superfamily [Austwickia chelonae]
MPELIQKPVHIAAGQGRTVDEYIGRSSTGHDIVSVARMGAPAGWVGNYHRPELDAITVVLTGTMLVDHDGGQARVRAGQALITRAGERVRYVSGDDGVDCMVVCLPAFSPEASPPVE